MLNAILRFSLRQRVPILAVSLFLMIVGGWTITKLPIDVFPDLDRPRVVIMTEAPGMAPEEIERQITFPLESAINGATGVQAVRTSSGVGLSVVYVEFDWGTDIYNDRQIVNERLALAADRLPEGVSPQLAPISSVMGQIMIIGLWSENPDVTPMQLRTDADWLIRTRLLTIPGVSQVFAMGGDRKQFQVLVSPSSLLRFGATVDEVKTALEESNENATGGYLDQQGPNEWLVRSIGRIRALDDLKKVVVAMRGGRPVLLEQVARVVEGPEVKRGDSAAFARREDGTFSGGPAVILTVNKQPSNKQQSSDTRKITQEVVRKLEQLQSEMPAGVHIEPHLYQQKAFIDAAIRNVAEALRDGGLLVVIVVFLFLLNFRITFITLTAIPLSLVITALVFTAFGLSINTMTLGGLAIAIGELVDDAIVDVENIFRRLKQNRHRAKPRGLLSVVYRASSEIRNSIVYGTIIVVLVFVPVFALSGMEGRLFRPLGIAYIVSIAASLLVSLTITPILSYWLLAMRRPWYVVSLPVTIPPCLAGAYLLLPRLMPLAGLSVPADWSPQTAWMYYVPAGLLASLPVWGVILWSERFGHGEGDGLVLACCKRLARGAISFSLRFPGTVLLAALVGVAVGLFGLLRLENNFLPPFNEGTIQLNIRLPPGTSLKTSTAVARQVENQLREIPDIAAFVRKTGRAELDEHAVTVNDTEVIASIRPDSELSREELLALVRKKMADVPGIQIGVDQPLQHLISHMLSGVQAQVAIKIYGESLPTLRSTARQVEAAIRDVRGVEDLYVEAQVDIPQLRIEPDRDRMKQLGLRVEDVNRLIETAMNGQVVSEVLDGQMAFDLILRLDEPYRENLETLRRLSIPLPDGGTTKLESVADIYEAAGPNTIQRENVQRRIVVQCNTSGRGLVDVVEEIQERLRPIEASLPRNYSIQYGGQFESRDSAARVMAVLFGLAMIGMFLVLYVMFRSANLSMQVMLALPTAFIGAVAALYLTHQTLTVAAMVGFISLCGIASRNGILLINHYLHLVRAEGQDWTPAMIVRAGTERVAPVLMTALTAGIGLVPLVLEGDQPGKEILYPVATVIIGGLITSTILEFFVRPAMFWKFGVRSGRRLILQEKAGQRRRARRRRSAREN